MIVYGLSVVLLPDRVDGTSLDVEWTIEPVEDSAKEDVSVDVLDVDSEVSVEVLDVEGTLEDLVDFVEELEVVFVELLEVDVLLKDFELDLDVEVDLDDVVDLEVVLEIEVDFVLLEVEVDDVLSEPAGQQYSGKSPLMFS